jgi:hypothetical protein
MAFSQSASIISLQAEDLLDKFWWNRFIGWINLLKSLSIPSPKAFTAVTKLVLAVSKEAEYVGLAATTSMALTAFRHVMQAAVKVFHNVVRSIGV